MVEPKAASKVILLAGLDNSGKTSIAYSLQGIKNLPHYLKIKPTVGRKIISIKSYDSEFRIWDLGGQDAYREEYIENLDKYFKGIDKLIYIFDIQDIDRYALALEYYEKIITFLKDNNKPNEIEISIFLHKFDPDLNTTKPEITKEIVDNLKNKIKNALNKTEFFYQIFQTTIYALFEKSVTD
ncbi:MAG: hypothetical protein EU532_03760 [Promethearchaeota archaeon]|nr:MAG: hypothetical protein EU532_03760 [Candidatus Lokiarchaeota archaeon]